MVVAAAVAGRGSRIVGGGWRVVDMQYFMGLVVACHGQLEERRVPSNSPKIAYRSSPSSFSSPSMLPDLVGTRSSGAPVVKGREGVNELELRGGVVLPCGKLYGLDQREKERAFSFCTFSSPGRHFAQHQGRSSPIIMVP